MKPRLSECEYRQAMGGWTEDRVLKRCSFPIGPRNCWSNLAYPIVGIAAYALSPTGAGLAFVFAMTILGIGSGLYHGLKTRWANRLDWLGIWAVLAGLVAHGAAPEYPHIGWVMVGATVVASLMLTYVWKQIGADILIGVGLVLASLPVFWTDRWLWGLASFACFGVAKICWNADKAEAAWVGLRGHDWWHRWSAVAFGLMYWAQKSGTTAW